MLHLLCKNCLCKTQLHGQIQKSPTVLKCMQKYWRLFQFSLYYLGKEMGLGFLVDQIYLVSWGNYDSHAKNLRFFWFFYFTQLHFKIAGPLHHPPLGFSEDTLNTKH